MSTGGPSAREHKDYVSEAMISHMLPVPKINITNDHMRSNVYSCEVLFNSFNSYLSLSAITTCKGGKNLTNISKDY